MVAGRAQIKLDELLKKYVYELDRKAHFEAELKRVEKLNSDLRTNNEALNKAIKNHEQENQGIKINLNYLEKQNEKISNQNNSQEKELRKNENIIIELRIELKNTQEKINQLNKLQKESEDKIEVLRQDNLFLNQEKSQLSGQFKQLQAMIVEKA